ncbi:MAG: TIGR04283 family arsenosugar biosynthesis glycosyltransferase [Thermodesulfobacteriota bacterium]
MTVEILKRTPMTAPAISIIVPVLNEGTTLRETLAHLPRAPDLEIILVDGGSTDHTLAVAADFPGIKMCAAPRGRGCQMNAGALASSGEWLVFVHADTHFRTEHLRSLRRAIQDPAFAAGAFELALRPPAPALRLIAWGANRRARTLGLPYGDQVLIIARPLFLSLGGFAHRRPEDLDLVLRLRKHARLHLLTPAVSSSGRRWLTQGYLYTTLKNWLDLARHLAERAFTSRWSEKGELKKGGRRRRPGVANPVNR